MKKSSATDSVFKEGLGTGTTGDAGAMWQRMHLILQQDQQRRKRRRYWLLLLLLPAAAGIFALKKTGNTAATAYTANSSAPATNPIAAPAAQKVQSTARAAAGNTTSSTAGNIPTATNAAGGTAVPQYAAPQALHTTKPGKAAVAIQAPDAGNDAPAQMGVTIQEPGTTDDFSGSSATPLPPMLHGAAARIAPAMQAHTAALHTSAVPPAAAAKHKPEAAERRSSHKPQVSLAAGTDLFASLKTGGKYALVQLRIPLRRSNSLLVGAGISSHATSQNYTVAEKQGTLNREIDAKLRGLTMVQLPILYEQQIPHTKLRARAGITPVYIINAAVTNTPSSFVGSVIPYRTFGLKDINRLNVLFTAGLQYNITPRLGVEARGNYGLTELVKNSYLNQSSENNNFKAVQLGLLWNFGKKQ